jgi:hypothetical protein
MGPSITVEESARQAGLGPMPAELLRQNLGQHPHRRRDLGRLAAGRLKIAGPGLLLRPMMIVRLTRLLNVAPD